MIRKELATTFICDNCGERFISDNGNVGHISDIWWEATFCAWVEIDGKHYCPDCYDYDKDTHGYKPIKKEEDE